MRGQVPVAQESGVAREDEPPLAARAVDQRPVAEVAAVDDVVTQDAEPAGEPAEHPVDGETLHLARLPLELGHGHRLV